MNTLKNSIMKKRVFSITWRGGVRGPVITGGYRGGGTGEPPDHQFPFHQSSTRATLAQCARTRVSALGAAGARPRGSADRSDCLFHSGGTAWRLRSVRRGLTVAVLAVGPACKVEGQLHTVRPGAEDRQGGEHDIRCSAGARGVAEGSEQLNQQALMRCSY